MADLLPPPLIQVSHLPSASTFYASLIQPLGLKFLLASPSSPPTTTLHYGFITSSFHTQTIFSVSESPFPKLSHITLSAPSSKAILEFHTLSIGLGVGLGRERRRGENTLVKNQDGEERAVTRDFDGNMVEAVYIPRLSRGGGGGRPREVTLETASTEKEAKRVLEWQENVARSISEEPEDERDDERVVGSRRQYSSSAPRPGVMSRADTFPRSLPTRRRETVTDHSYRRETERDAIGISSNALLGTLVAAAAGSALLYSLVNSRSQEPDPPIRRRASETHYTHSPIRMEDRETVVETIPARSYVTQREREREERKPRYVQYTIAAPPPPAPSRELARIEGKSYSHVSTRSHRTSHTRERSRSEVGPRSLTLNPAPPPPPPPPPASHVSSRRSHKSERERERDRSGSGGSSGRERERERERERDRERRSHKSSVTESYTSARTHHSSSTIKAPPEVPVPPPAASFVSTSTVRMVPRSHVSHASERQRDIEFEREKQRDRERERERDNRERERREWERARMVPLPESVVSARQVPLPMSLVGDRGDRGGGGYEYEYEASVAPSDSVSSVGVKRERERLRDRMRERGLVGRWDS